jgi:proteasome lid subunit RPN8/RPN11
MSTQMKTQVLDDRLVREIGHIGEERSPAEACGIMLPTPHKGKRVWELPNRSNRSNDSFVMLGSDIAMVLGDWDGPYEEIVMWHTHPAGNVGPSQADIQNRVVKFPNLVVTIRKGDKPLATWF